MLGCKYSLDALSTSYLKSNQSSITNHHITYFIKEQFFLKRFTFNEVMFYKHWKISVIHFLEKSPFEMAMMICFRQGDATD